MNRRLPAVAAVVVLATVSWGGTVTTPAPAAPPGHATGHNAVARWAAIVGRAVHNPEAPRHPVGAVFAHAVVHLAVWDAVVAIEGGFKPYASYVDAPDGASLDAAVATAAWRTARARVAGSQLGYLDEHYEAALAAIPDGTAETAGVAVGRAAADAVLELRVNETKGEPVPYTCTSVPPPPGEFEPDGGCGTQPVGTEISAWVPFTFDDPAQFRPDGPRPLTSEEWAAEFAEVKELGGADSAVRTAEQTAVVHFWNEHGYVQWTRNLIALAAERDLGVVETARLMVMVFTAMADAGIAGGEAKYHYRFWRPRTAVPRAAEDGNPATEPDPTWKPLLTVNHPEYPSGHAYVSGAATTAIAAFLGTDDVDLTMTSMQPKGLVERSFADVDAVMEDVANARVWAGLHYRTSMRDGGELGERVARHVASEFFGATG